MSEINPGAVVVQLYDSAGAPIPKIQVLLACVNLLNPDGTMQADDKITREGGNVSWTWYPVDTEYELRINTYEPQPQYTSIIVRIPNAQIAQLHTYTLQASGGQPLPEPDGLTTINCPHNSTYKGYGTSQEWKPIAHNIVNGLHLGIMEPDQQHGGNGHQPNLEAFDAALRKIPVPVGFSQCQLQHDSGGDLKPRIFLPVKPQNNVPDCGVFSRPVDIGDFGFPFFCNATSTDEWQLTGRPAGSQW